MNLELSIKKYALENAVKFNGKCNPGAVIGKILGEYASLKNNMDVLVPKINETAKKVNSMSVEEQKKELLKIVPDYFEEQKELKEKRKEERHELPELKNAVMGKVVTRIPPEPSKYNHFGHAMSFLINYLYALKYTGKCIIRYEDTNPEKEAQEYVDAMNEDVLEYLGIKADKTVFVSDHIDKYYEFGEQLIKEGKTYTCICKSEEISKRRRDMTECVCRKKVPAVVKKEWDEMKKGGYEEGAVTLRLKIDMAHKNAVMRDPVIFRLCYTPHYRQGAKYKVWPMYDFENAVEEGLLGITHVLRSNEFESRIELQEYIRNLFGLPHPVIRQYARFNIMGAVTQGREIRKLIESGEYSGWDDIRLVTLRALKRRGIVKETLYEMSKIVGLSKANSNMDFSVIASVNRKILDGRAKRFFFISDPHEIIVEGAPELDVVLDLHPDNKKGGRKFRAKGRFYITQEDYKSISDNELVRLMDCFNIRKSNKSFKFAGKNIDDYRKAGKKIVHWLPVEKLTEVEVLMPDNKQVFGLAENTIKTLKEGDIIQFERFGFCRLDSIKDNKYKFWFAHK
jgi:glutamyl-tRNA synthetase